MTDNISKRDKLPFTEKYRPRKLPELVIDPIIYAKVNNIILNKDVPNLIFTGKSGVGKTSSIHCIAKAIYPRNTISDSVVELNASDDRGIKSVQDTIINFCKKKVEYVNGYAQHKLLILDEADNITPKAQKLISLIMEKYPTTRFAFTCNNSADIIESIQSRCVIIKFVKPPICHYIQRLEYICKNENIDYEPETFEYIFNLCQKDIRQSINILELTYYSFNKITISNINMICDVPSKAIFDNLYGYITNKDIVNITKIINQFKNDGYNSLDVLLHFIYYLKSVDNDEDTRINIINILSDYSYTMSKSISNYLQLTSAFYNCFL
jgi:replication factor C subunit 2/4